MDEVPASVLVFDLPYPKSLAELLGSLAPLLAVDRFVGVLHLFVSGNQGPFACSLFYQSLNELTFGYPQGKSFLSD
jgi:hypothetical protein